MSIYERVAEQLKHNRQLRKVGTVAAMYSRFGADPWGAERLKHEFRRHRANTPEQLKALRGHDPYNHTGSKL